jgi:hypothetical protein
MFLALTSQLFQKLHPRCILGIKLPIQKNDKNEIIFQFFTENIRNNILCL